MLEEVWDVEGRRACESVSDDLDLSFFDLRKFPAPPRPVTRGGLRAGSRLRCCTNSVSAARVACVSDCDMCRFGALADVAFPAPPLPVTKIYDSKGLVERSPDKKDVPLLDRSWASTECHVRLATGCRLQPEISPKAMA